MNHNTTHRRWPIACALVSLTVVVGGCQQAQKIIEDVKSSLPGAGNTSVPNSSALPKAPNLMQTGQKKKSAPVRQTRASKWIRSNRSANGLFNKKTVTGRDLLVELVALQAAVVSGSVDQGMTALMGNSRGAPAAQNQAFFAEIKAAFGELFQPNVGTTAIKATNDFFDRVIGKKDVLAKQTLELPDPKELNRLERQQVLVLAAMVMGFKVSNVIMEDAVKDLENVEKMYANLLERRVQAAQLLLDVLIEREKAEKTRAEAIARDLSRLMSKDDMVLLEGLAATQNLKSFAGDLGAQNLALRYMQRKDPKAYKSYRVSAGKFVSEYTALLRAAGGATAFGAFGSGFYKKAKEMVAQSGLIAGALKMPFGREILTEGGRLSASATSIAGSGGFLSKLLGGGGFNMYQAGNPLETNVSVARITSRLDQVGAGERFKSQLIAAKGRGYLNRVHACEPSLVGDFLDDVVPSETRLAFAQNYYGLKDSAREFTFRNAMDGAVKSRGRKTMVRDLLRRSAPKAKDKISQSIAAVHQAAQQNISEMDRKQFLRLVFANARGNPRQASMDVGEVKIALVPDRESIYVYEKYVTGCMKRFVKS